MAQVVQKKGNPYYEFLGIKKYWRFSQERMNNMYENGLIVKTGSNLQQKYYLKDAEKSRKTVTSWWDEGYYTSSATSKLNNLMGENLFDTPKPVDLILKMLNMFTFQNMQATIIDFFAGSATTADAVMQLNANDGGHRKYILCTLDEEVSEKSSAKDAGYRTIDQISRERIRRAADKIRNQNPENAQNQDFGFKAFKLDTSNFKDVYQSPEQYQQVNLLDNISNIKENRNDLDLLFQVMLTWGMELSLSVKKEQLAQSTIYNVAENALIACFAEDITEDVIRQIAQKEPLRAVFKDSSFANSADKTNLSQIFKEVSPKTKIKVV